MRTAGYIALSQQMALSREMDVVANNVANMNTPGFKSQSLQFVQYLEQPAGNASAPTTYAMVEDRGTVRSLDQGPMTKTDNPLDIAIDGSGYYVVDTPQGQRYARSGRFSLDSNRDIVTTDGLKVMDDSNRPINIPPDSGPLSVNPDGTVSTMTNTSTGSQTTVIGKLKVVQFTQEQALQPLGSKLFTTDEIPQPATNATLRQGMIEESNVKPIAAMAQMMEVLRAYQSTQKLLDAENTREKSAIDKLAKVS